MTKPWADLQLGWDVFLRATAALPRLKMNITDELVGWSCDNRWHFAQDFDGTYLQLRRADGFEYISELKR